MSAITGAYIYEQDMDREILDVQDYELDANVENESTNQERERVVLSVQFKNNKLAAACYLALTSELLILESTDEQSPDFHILRTLLDNIKPMQVVVCASSGSKLTKHLIKLMDNATYPVSLEKLSPRHFNYSASLNKLLTLNVRNSSNGDHNYLLSILNMTDERLISTIGGLLYYLSVAVPNLQLNKPYLIADIKPIQMGSLLMVDDETYKNLQIFNPLQHPSSFKWSLQDTNEGLCMYNIFEKNCSSLGLNRLRSFMSLPTCDIPTIQKRHEVINFFMHPHNAHIVQMLKTFASQVCSPTVLINYLERANLRGGHWKIIYRIIFYTISYAEVCKTNSKQVQLFEELGAEINDIVFSMAHNLENTIDLVNMEKNEQFVIKHGFFGAIDEAKLKFSKLTQDMDEITPCEFDIVPEFITQIKVLYIPELKFVLSIPFWKAELTLKELQLPNIHFLFVANKIAFYKTPRCYELDQFVGDAQAEIIKQETNIIRALGRYLKKNIHHIVVLINRIIELECIFSLAKAAKEYGFVEPEIVSEKLFEVVNGWHPLLKIHTDNYIANSLLSSITDGLVNLLFGPNGSGKTIFLKQNALIAYLAHIGSFIPAEKGRIGLLNRIYARLQESESVVSKASSLMLELRNIAYATNQMSSTSFLVLDELGKGSSELNCSAILTSSIIHFLERGENCPHVLISTHITNVCDHLTQQPLLSLLVMDHIVSNGELVFLHQVKKSFTYSNYVFEVIETLKSSLPFVKSAMTVLEAMRTGKYVLPYGKLRISRSEKHMKFIKKFVDLDMNKAGYLLKLEEKIKRYYKRGVSINFFSMENGME